MNVSSLPLQSDSSCILQGGHPPKCRSLHLFDMLSVQTSCKSHMGRPRALCTAHIINNYCGSPYSVPPTIFASSPAVFFILILIFLSVDDGSDTPFNFFNTSSVISTAPAGTTLVHNDAYILFLLQQPRFVFPPLTGSVSVCFVQKSFSPLALPVPFSAYLHQTTPPVNLLSIYSVFPHSYL